MLNHDKYLITIALCFFIFYFLSISILFKKIILKYRYTEILFIETVKMIEETIFWINTFID